MIRQALPSNSKASPCKTWNISPWFFVSKLADIFGTPLCMDDSNSVTRDQPPQSEMILARHNSCDNDREQILLGCDPRRSGGKNTTKNARQARREILGRTHAHSHVTRALQIGLQEYGHVYKAKRCSHTEPQQQHKVQQSA